MGINFIPPSHLHPRSIMNHTYVTDLVPICKYREFVAKKKDESLISYEAERLRLLADVYSSRDSLFAALITSYDYIVTNDNLAYLSEYVRANSLAYQTALAAYGSFFGKNIVSSMATTLLRA